MKKLTVNAYFCVLAGFLLVSCSYISWVHHIESIATTLSVDFASAVLAYLFQGLGVLIFSLLILTKVKAVFSGFFISAIHFVYYLTLMPALYSKTITGTHLYGFVMSIMSGMILAFYLYVLTFQGEGKRRGLIFGGGFATAILLIRLLSLVPENFLLTTPMSMFLYAGVTFLATFFTVRCFGKDGELADRDVLFGPLEHKSIFIPAIVFIFLFSLIRTLGISALIANPEDLFARKYNMISCAIGLVATGYLYDKNKKLGSALAMVSLITPFLLLLDKNSIIPGAIPMALDSLFFGVFSIYRILFFSDISASRKIPPVLFAMGLVFGRFGDAFGNWLGLIQRENRRFAFVIYGILLIITILFFVYMLIRIFAKRGEAKAEEAKEEEAKEEEAKAEKAKEEEAKA